MANYLLLGRFTLPSNPRLRAREQHPTGMGELQPLPQFPLWQLPQARKGRD